MRSSSLWLAVVVLGLGCAREAWGMEGGAVASREAAPTDVRPTTARDEPAFEARGVIGRFSTDGAQLVLGGHRVGMNVVAMGRAGTPTPLAPVSRATVDGSDVRMDRGAGVVEWWRRLELGLEHGLTLAERPPSRGELQIYVEVAGDLVPRVASDDAVELVGPRGARVATYAGLMALDASGARMPARMEVRAGRIALVVDDRTARYPLIVDPIVVIDEATLVHTAPVADDSFGGAVGIAADGTRVAVGVPNDRPPPPMLGDGGSVLIFTRSGAAWSAETTLACRHALISTANDPGQRCGAAVAVTADATRVIVGAPEADRQFTSGGPTTSAAGTATVFVRAGSFWMREADHLDRGSSADDNLGAAVAITGDGSRAAVGVPGRGAGLVRVYLRIGTTWATEANLSAAGAVAGERFGSGVAIDAAGAVLVATSSGTATARRFVRTGTVWAEAAPLTPTMGLLGPGVSLASDGSRTAIRTSGGIVTVFADSGGTWGEEARLSVNGRSSVGLNADGSRLVIGIPQREAPDLLYAGAATVWRRTGSAWAELAPLPYPGAEALSAVGIAVGITAGGERAVVTASSDDLTGSANAGSAHVYVIGATVGDPCTTGVECISTFCVDGVCCDAACGGGSATDCQACSATLTGGTSGTCAPLSAAVAPTVTCRASAGACDVVDVCVPSTTTCPDALLPGSTACRPASGACDAEERCDGASPACPGDGRLPSGVVCRANAGPCDLPEQCDGSSAACPADGFAAATVTCRASIGPCDAVDRCDGTSAACADRFLSGTTCRVAISPCDVPEACGGSEATCPNDTFASAGTLCNGFIVDVCDAPDTCDGTSAACPPAFRSGVSCRAAAGACDVAESCTGGDVACPPDVLVAAGVTCGGSVPGSCSSAGTCTGSSATCPGATPFAAGTVCLPAEVGNPCDVDDTCDGTSDACQPAYVAAGTECAPSGGDVCDTPDVCAGTSADCIATFVAGVECRSPLGPCDTAEFCSGSAASCPPDALEAAGQSCRASTDTSCDPEEVCDGTSASCPADVTSCGAGSDAGLDAGRTDGGPPAVDAAVGPDGGPAPTVAAGCACRLGTREPRGRWGAVTALFLALALRRRRPQERV